MRYSQIESTSSNRLASFSTYILFVFLPPIRIAARLFVRIISIAIIFCNTTDIHRSFEKIIPLIQGKNDTAFGFIQICKFDKAHYANQSFLINLYPATIISMNATSIFTVLHTEPLYNYLIKACTIDDIHQT